MEFDPGLIEYLKRKFAVQGPPPSPVEDPSQVVEPLPKAQPVSAPPLPKAEPAPTPQPAPYDWRNDPELLDAVRAGVEGVRTGANKIGDASLLYAGKDPRRPPYQAEGLRERLGFLRQGQMLGQKHQWQDEAAQTLRDFEASQNEKNRENRLNVAEIGAASRMFSPGGGLTTEEREANRKLREREIGVQQQRADTQKTQGEARIQNQITGLKQSDERTHMVANPQLERIAAYQQTMSKLKMIEDKLPEIINSSGPIERQFKNLFVDLGFADADTAEDAAVLTSALGNYLTTQTGAQRGMEEVRFLARAMPALRQNPEQFVSTLRKIENLTSTDYDAYIDTLKRGKKDVTNFERGKPVKVKINGVIYPGTEESIKKLQADNIPFELVQ
jgi:hypothetical protein